MGRDFYKILGVQKTADEKTIRKAYKKLAVTWHPDKNPDKKEEATKKFKEISEAYDILSDKEKRKLYDQFGEEGINPKVNPGFGGEGGQGFSGFSDQRAQDIFAQFFGGRGGGFSFGGGGRGGNHGGFSFGGDDDGDEDMDGGGHGFGGMPGFGGFGGFPGFGGGGFQQQQQQRRPKKPPTITHEMYFTLEELYKGLTKKVKITRNVINDDGRTMRAESEVKSFDVKPGWKNGTKITFEGAGDQPSKDAPPGDIVFLIQEKPHHLFKRSGDDLIHNATITLKQALCGGTYKLTHLDGTTLEVPLFNVISPGSVTSIAGKGMPISRNPNQKGNLKISFNVTFPNQLSEQQKNELKKIL